MILTVAEADALIQAELGSTDPKRGAWDAASAADQGVALRRAAAKIDACRWKGRAEDPEQEHAFPRVQHDGAALVLEPELEPDGGGDWTYAGFPGSIRRATAIQAAAEARDALGLQRTGQAREQAQRGVTSRSQPAGGESVQLARATSAWAAIHPDAQTIAARYRAAGASAA